MRTIKIIVNTPNINVFVEPAKKKDAKAITENLVTNFIRGKLGENLENWVKEFDDSVGKQLTELEEKNKGEEK